MTPCHYISDRIPRGSVVVDAGLGADADFAVALVERFGAKALGFDPTRKHAESLERIAETLGGALVFHPLAIVGKDVEEIRFAESNENVSGSIMARHVNVERDSTTEYTVRATTLRQVLEALDVYPSIVKLDIEGSEYGVIDALSDRELSIVRQWVVEFHHDTVRNLRVSDTRKIIDRFERLGFEMFSRDFVNFTFVRRGDERPL